MKITEFFSGKRKLSKKIDLSVFSAIAKANAWECPESLSGPGSTLEATQSLRTGLSEAFRQLGIRSLVDAPCGDMNWMRHLDYRFDKYIGIDIVPALIEKLKEKRFPPSHHFQVGNIVTDVLPQADALLCRDCLVHLPLQAILEAQRLWKQAGFTYVLATTFPNWDVNVDCIAGEWRPLNMQAAPFFWPPPRLVIKENARLEPPYDSKSIGVWVL